MKLINFIFWSGVIILVAGLVIGACGYYLTGVVMGDRPSMWNPDSQYFDYDNPSGMYEYDLWKAQFWQYLGGAMVFSGFILSALTYDSIWPRKEAPK